MWAGVRDYFDFNRGAIDVLVVRQEDGSFLSTPFHVRFGQGHFIRTKPKRVTIIVDGVPASVQMHLGEAGEAYFLINEPTEEPKENPAAVLPPGSVLPTAVAPPTTSLPAASPTSSTLSALSNSTPGSPSRTSKGSGIDEPPKKWRWAWGGLPRKTQSPMSSSLSSSLEDLPTSLSLSTAAGAAQPTDGNSSAVPSPGAEKKSGLDATITTTTTTTSNSDKAPTTSSESSATGVPTSSSSSWGLFNLWKKEEPVYTFKPIESDFYASLLAAEDTTADDQDFYSASISPRGYQSAVLPRNLSLENFIDYYGSDSDEEGDKTPPPEKEDDAEIFSYEDFEQTRPVVSLPRSKRRSRRFSRLIESIQEQEHEHEHEHSDLTHSSTAAPKLLVPTEPEQQQSQQQIATDGDNVLIAIATNKLSMSRSPLVPFRSSSVPVSTSDSRFQFQQVPANPSSTVSSPALSRASSHTASGLEFRKEVVPPLNNNRDHEPTSNLIIPEISTQPSSIPSQPIIITPSTQEPTLTPPQQPATLSEELPDKFPFSMEREEHWRSMDFDRASSACVTLQRERDAIRARRASLMQGSVLSKSMDDIDRLLANGKQGAKAEFDREPSASKEQPQTDDVEGCELHELTVQISLCRSLVFERTESQDIHAIFEHHMVPYSEYATAKTLTSNPELLYRLNGKIYPPKVAIPIMTAFSVYKKSLPPKVIAELEDEELREHALTRRSGWAWWWSSSNQTSTAASRTTSTSQISAAEPPSSTVL
eukprot:TRINITY_DN4096_c0_g1_i1.p1 TRINITY_DN4096_c0_g1~~TRINITY_DN4096_c0_g1_i1.p1  ORF type:complete len:761 (+),score=154.89 TRINITY_DN4096_c0_g1_i1:75-2357(+)